MNNNKFLKTLSRMPPETFKEFCKSAKKNGQEGSAAIKVLSYLKTFYPNFDTPKLEKHTAFKRIFKGEKFSQTKIENATYDLHKSLNGFLSEQAFKEDKFVQELYLLKAYERLKLNNLAQKQLEKLEIILVKTSKNDSEFWQNQLLVSREKYFNSRLERIALEGEKIKQAVRDLDGFYDLVKLKYYSELAARTQVVSEIIEDKKIVAEILKGDWKKISELHYLYQISLKLNYEKSASDYFELKGLVLKNINKLGDQDNYVLLTYLINYTAYRIRQGNQDFGKEAFELFQYGIETKLFFENGYFNDTHFVNMVDVAGALGKTDWAEQFINKWKHFLDKNNYELVLNFSIALLHFWKKEFEKSLTILRENYKKNIAFDIKSRLIRLACKYEEAEDLNHIYSECSALEQYINRNLVANISIKKSALGFSRILKKLTAVEPNKELIWRHLNRKEFIYYKSWLIAKVQELK